MSTSTTVLARRNALLLTRLAQDATLTFTDGETRVHVSNQAVLAGISPMINALFFSKAGGWSCSVP